MSEWWNFLLSMWKFDAAALWESTMLIQSTKQSAACSWIGRQYSSWKRRSSYKIWHGYSLPLLRYCSISMGSGSPSRLLNLNLSSLGEKLLRFSASFKPILAKKQRINWFLIHDSKQLMIKVFLDSLIRTSESGNTFFWICDSNQLIKKHLFRQLFRIMNQEPIDSLFLCQSLDSFKWFHIRNIQLIIYLCYVI